MLKIYLVLKILNNIIYRENSHFIFIGPCLVKGSSRTKRYRRFSLTDLLYLSVAEPSDDNSEPENLSTKPEDLSSKAPPVSPPVGVALISGAPTAWPENDWKAAAVEAAWKGPLEPLCLNAEPIYRQPYRPYQLYRPLPTYPDGVFLPPYSRPRSYSPYPEDLSSPNSSPSSPRPARETPRYRCSFCSKSYSTHSGLSKHQQFHCSANEDSTAKKTFSCKHCDKVYVSLGALKMHIRTHTLPCKCELCGKAFSRPWLLQGHIRTHTGEKPFTCPHCNRAFADRSNLRAHLQTHSDVKKYSCPACSKTFSRMSLLTKHCDGGCPAASAASSPSYIASSPASSASPSYRPSSPPSISSPPAYSPYHLQILSS